MIRCDSQFLFRTVISLFICMFFRSDFKPTVGIGSTPGGVNRIGLIVGTTVSAVVLAIVLLFAIFYME